MARWFHLAQLAQDHHIQRSAPALASAATKLLGAIDFESDTSLTPEEAKALVKWIHGYIHAGQAADERAREKSLRDR